MKMNVLGRAELDMTIGINNNMDGMEDINRTVDMLMTRGKCLRTIDTLWLINGWEINLSLGNWKKRMNLKNLGMDHFQKSKNNSAYKIYVNQFIFQKEHDKNQS